MFAYMDLTGTGATYKWLFIFDFRYYETHACDITHTITNKRIPDRHKYLWNLAQQYQIVINKYMHSPGPMHTRADTNRHTQPHQH